LSLGGTEEEGVGQTPRALLYFPPPPFSLLRLGATEEEGRQRMLALSLSSHLSSLLPPGPWGNGGGGKRMTNKMYVFVLGGCGAELNLFPYCSVMVLTWYSDCIRIERKRK